MGPSALLKAPYLRNSSVGRALVSKTRCREFEPLFPCQSEINMKLINDIKESYDELVYKVSWPTQKQLINSSVLVLIASIIIAVFIWVVDKIFNLLMELVYSISF